MLLRPVGPGHGGATSLRSFPPSFCLRRIGGSAPATPLVAPPPDPRFGLRPDPPVGGSARTRPWGAAPAAPVSGYRPRRSLRRGASLCLLRNRRRGASVGRIREVPSAILRSWCSLAWGG